MDSAIKPSKTQKSVAAISPPGQLEPGSLHQQLVEHFPSPVFTVDRQGLVLLWNRACEQIFRIPAAEIIGSSFLELIVLPTDRVFYRELVEKVFQQKVISNLETMFVDREGARVWMLTRLFPLRDREGVLSACAFSGIEISLWKEREQALHHSEEVYRSLVENLSEAFYVVDRRGGVIYLSPVMKKIIGYCPAELVGRSCWQLIHPEDRRPLRELLRESGLEQPLSLEFRVTARSGQLRWVRASIGRSSPRDGVECLQGILSDITERKLAEERLAGSLREKDLLLKEIHHRVKNNLQIISSLLDMAAMRPGGHLALEILRDARAKIHTMALIHNQLYSSNRFDRIDMGDYAAELAGYLSRMYPAAGRVRMELDCRRACLPVTRAVPCALVLSELLCNCFKHAFSAEQPDCRIELGVKISTEGTIIIKVSDNGRGLPAGLDWGGLHSMGMVLVRNLVQEQLGGSISLGGPPGLAVEFRFTAEEV